MKNTYKYLKEKKVDGKKKLRHVRVMGNDTWIEEGVFEAAVRNGQVFFKVNKPYTEKDLANDKF